MILYGRCALGEHSAIEHWLMGEPLNRQSLYPRFLCLKRAVCSGVWEFAACFRFAIPEVRGKTVIWRADPGFTLTRPAVLFTKIELCSGIANFSPHFRKIGSLAAICGPFGRATGRHRTYVIGGRHHRAKPHDNPMVYSAPYPAQRKGGKAPASLTDGRACGTFPDALIRLGYSTEPKTEEGRSP